MISVELGMPLEAYPPFYFPISYHGSMNMAAVRTSELGMTLAGFWNVW